MSLNVTRVLCWVYIVYVGKKRGLIKMALNAIISINYLCFNGVCYSYHFVFKQTVSYE